MKYFNYFKLKVLNSIKNVKLVGEDFILFDSGMCLTFDFKETEKQLTNSNYKHKIHACVQEIKKTVEMSKDDKHYTNVINFLVSQLEGYYKNIKIYEKEGYLILNIMLLDGSDFVRKYSINSFENEAALIFELNAICTKIVSEHKKYDNVVDDDYSVENPEVLDTDILPKNVIKME